MPRTISQIVFAALLSAPLAITAQDSVPTEIMQRTIYIKFGNESGTGFTVDYEGKLYLVTARHVVFGAPPTNAVLELFQEGRWKEYKTVRTLFPASQDVDIAVFETPEKASAPYSVRPEEAKRPGGVGLGQQVWFLGYPYGIATHFAKGGATSPFGDSLMAPFIKRGTLSAVDATDPAAVIFYIDGFNNPGFSGGPIIYYDHASQKYAILAVVKGYREDSAKVLINGQHVDTQILVNTGILVGYSIKHAVDTIKAAQTPTQPAH